MHINYLMQQRDIHYAVMVMGRWHTSATIFNAAIVLYTYTHTHTYNATNNWDCTA